MTSTKLTPKEVEEDIEIDRILSTNKRTNVSDFDFKFDQKLNDHKRREKIENTVTNIVSIAIWLICLIFLVLFIGLLYHYWKSSDWNSLEKIFYGGSGILVGYIASVLEKNGLKNNFKK